MQSLLNFEATYDSCFKIWDLKGYLYSKIGVTETIWMGVVVMKEKRKVN